MRKSRVTEALEALLQSQPVCYRQAAERVFSVHEHVKTVLRKMHKAGKVHRVGWVNRRPVFAWGPGEDVPYISIRASDAERKRISRANMSVEERDFRAARRRQQRRTIKVDPLISAFFGVKK